MPKGAVRIVLLVARTHGNAGVLKRASPSSIPGAPALRHIPRSRQHYLRIDRVQLEQRERQRHISCTLCNWCSKHGDKSSCIMSKLHKFFVIILMQVSTTKHTFIQSIELCKANGAFATSLVRLRTSRHQRRLL
jgi:hypothetical protein